MKALNVIVEVKDLWKTYNGKTALRGVTIQAQENEILALMGPNGSGKTTLLACICGADRPTRGEISILGERPSSREALENISFLTQSGMGLKYLTGEENIRFYLDLHPSSTDRWKILFRRFEMENDINRLLKNYSGGMTRKIELISALSPDVPIYILDEPSLELDLSMIRVLHDVLLKLKEEGKTIILATHDPMDAEIADRIIFMRNGEVTVTDTPEKLLESVPPVIRIVPTTTKVNNTIQRHFMGKEIKIFEKGGEGRAFLLPKKLKLLDKIKKEAQKINSYVEVQKDHTTWTDMFNYYTYIYENSLKVSNTTKF